MKIIYFGTSDFAIVPLEKLYSSKDFEIKAVITQPDKPAGRKKKLSPPPVKVLAQKLDLNVLQPNSIEEIKNELEKLEADFFVVISYGQILKKSILKIPKGVCINIHASLLPKYRGASPIQQALLNGDKETGITVMKMNERMDAGDIYLIRRLVIENNDDYESLEQKLSLLSAEILPTVLKDIKDSYLTGIPQNEKNATYCKKITRQDGKIDWNESSSKIINKIKAFSKWPQTFSDLRDKKLKILKAKKSEKNLTPGKFELEEGNLYIGCGDASICPLVVQLEGKKQMEIKDFINGYKDLIK